MKKLEILVYHLGYGGIEQAVSSFANLMKDDFEISIVSFYKLYEEPIFKIPSSIPITYLYHSNVPLKVKKYNQLLHQKRIGTLFQELFKDYAKKGKFGEFFHDLGFSIGAYFFKGRYRRLKKYLKKSRADIYLSTRFEISKILTKYGYKNALKIGWEHNHYHGNMKYKSNVLKGSRNLDHLIVVSRALANEYQEELKHEKCHCTYIPNMIDYELPFVSDYKERRILFVGRLEKEKGLFDAIDVMKRLQEKMVPFHFDIVGDGPLREELESYSRGKELHPYIQFHGFQSHAYIENLYQHASLYLMTSFTESFGLVVIEAMNAGLPTIAFSSAEGARELVLNDTNGYLIQNRNLDEMAEKVIFLLEHPEEIARLGKNAKEFSKNFLPTSVRVMWLSILE